jgi:gluconolactonase
MNNSINRRTFIRLSIGMLASSMLSACKSIISTSATESTALDHPTDESPNIIEQSNTEYTILANDINFPEGPAFDPQGTIWCTEMGRGNLIYLSDGQILRIPVYGRPNSLAFDDQGRAWICDSEHNSIRRFDLVTQSWETMLESTEGHSLQTPNDLIFDSAGNLLFSCPNYSDEKQTGYIVCLSPDGTSKIIIEKMNRPNGLGLANDGNNLIVADTFTKTLYKGTWDPINKLCTNFKAWSVVGGNEGPDGLAVSGENLVFVAIYGDGEIRILDQQGQFTGNLTVPGGNPTNIAIDPNGQYGLVVTEAEKGQLISFPHFVITPQIFDGGAAWP